MENHHSDGVVTVLIVDDDEVDVRAIKRAIRKNCMDNPIVTARDGVEALEILRGSAATSPLDPPFLILLDLNMPRMNGLEFLEALRDDDNLKSSVVFVLTTSEDDSDIHEAYDHQIAGYIVKNEVGIHFVKLITMLEKFVITVRLPSTMTEATKDEQDTQ